MYLPETPRVTAGRPVKECLCVDHSCKKCKANARRRQNYAHKKEVTRTQAALAKGLPEADDMLAKLLHPASGNRTAYRLYPAMALQFRIATDYKAVGTSVASILKDLGADKRSKIKGKLVARLATGDGINPPPSNDFFVNQCR